MSQIKHYLSLVKFSHTIFAMPFALIGFFLGWKAVDEFSFRVIPGWHVKITSLRATGPVPQRTSEWILRFVLVVACMVFARSAAMGFNRFLDRHFDARNPRTAIREIPAGIISKEGALRFVIVNCLLFMACSYFINPLCFFLSPVALAVVLGYSYTKRFTPLCHLVLGLGLSLAPIGAYLAVTGQFHWLPLLFSLSVVCWVSGFDIIYALQDVDFDRSEKLHSIPAWLGREKALRVSRVLHLGSAAFVIAAGWVGHFSWLYAIGLGLFCGMLIYQHSLVKPHDLRRVNIAFMTANGIASVCFAIFVIADLLILHPAY